MEENFIDIEIKSEKEFLDSINKNLEKINSNKSNAFFEEDCPDNTDNLEQIFSNQKMIFKDLIENDDCEIEDHKEENNIINNILIELNKNIEIDIPENQECKEILQILRKPYSDKDLRKNNPFKSLSKPRKISLVGRVFSDIPDDEESATTKNSNSSIHNNLIFEKQ